MTKQNKTKAAVKTAKKVTKPFSSSTIATLYLMNTIDTIKKEFEEKFTVASPKSRNVYAEVTELWSWIEQSLERVKKEEREHCAEAIVKDARERGAVMVYKEQIIKILNND